MATFAIRSLVMSIAACAMFDAAICLAGKPSMEECLEATEFIGNAALARDAGMSADQFLGRMEEDFHLIQFYPSEMRWFVHDADDEAFLLGEARAVYEDPADPATHRARFLKDCVDRMLV